MIATRPAPSRGVRLLGASDLHLGRRVLRIPPLLEELGVSPRDLTPVAAWQRLVTHACAAEGNDGYDAVLLTGDVAESSDHFYEAYAPLEEGVARLVDSGIPVYAVAGNHDGVILPRLAREIPGFRLLGAGGKWESALLETDAGRVRLLGWSFPRRHFSDNPLDTLPPLPDDEIPTIGLLHGDLETPRSRYAPISRPELERTSCAAWLLGHLHRPDPFDRPPFVGYVGSPMGLDSSETGPHGFVEVEVRSRHEVTVTRRDAAPLVWEEWPIDITELARSEDLQSPVTARLRQAEEASRRAFLPPVAVVGRLTLTGACAFSEELDALVSRWIHEPPHVGRDDRYVMVGEVVNETLPGIAIRELARGDDLPALLARRLLDLREGEPLDAELWESLRRELSEVLDQPTWRGLEPLEPTEEDARTLCLDAGTRALAALWRGREE